MRRGAGHVAARGKSIVAKGNNGVHDLQTGFFTPKPKRGSLATWFSRRAILTETGCLSKPYIATSHENSACCNFRRSLKPAANLPCNLITLRNFDPCEYE